MHFPPEVFNIIKEFLLGIPFEEDRKHYRKYSHFEIDDIINTKGYKTSKGKLWNCIVKQYQRKNNIIYNEKKFVHGFVQYSNVYYENGTPSVFYKYNKYGKQHGTSICYHKNCKLQMIMRHRNGKLHGVTEKYDENGNYYLSEHFENGKLLK